MFVDGIQSEEIPAADVVPNPAALCNRRRFDSSNLHEICGYMCGLFGSHRLAASSDVASIKFSHCSATVQSISIDVVDYGTDRGFITISDGDASEHYLAQITLKGHCEITQGRTSVDLSPGTVYVINPDRPLSIRMDSGYTQMVLRIKRAALQEALSRDAGFSINEPVIFSNTTDALGVSSEGLLRMIAAVCDDLNSAASGFAKTKVAPCIEETLLTLLLNTIPHNFSGLLEKEYSVPMPHFMQRALSYLTSHCKNPILFSDLVAASGVSARSLHAGFREYKNTTPMNYLKTCRLEMAYRTLIRPDFDGQSITDVAFGYGFNHLSKFSKDYRLRFGESPCQTVSRSRIQSKKGEH